MTESAIVDYILVYVTALLSLRKRLTNHRARELWQTVTFLIISVCLNAYR